MPASTAWPSRCARSASRSTGAGSSRRGSSWRRGRRPGTSLTTRVNGVPCSSGVVSRRHRAEADLAPPRVQLGRPPDCRPRQRVERLLAVAPGPPQLRRRRTSSRSTRRAVRTDLDLGPRPATVAATRTRRRPGDALDVGVHLDPAAASGRRSPAAAPWPAGPCRHGCSLTGRQMPAVTRSAPSPSRSCRPSSGWSCTGGGWRAAGRRARWLVLLGVADWPSERRPRAVVAVRRTVATSNGSRGACSRCAPTTRR